MKAKIKFNNPLVKLALYLGLVWFTFWQPVIVIFWLKNGLTMSSIMLLKSLHGIAVLLLEVPTGIIADRYGAKKLFIYASILYVISLFVYAVGHSFLIFLIAELIAAFGTALVSGSDSAYVYTFLDRENKTDAFSDVLGKIHSFRLFSQTIAGILGGFVAQFISLRFTLVLTIIPNAASILVALSLPDIKAIRKKKVKAFGIFIKGVKSLITNPKNIYFSVNYIVIVAAGLSLFWIYQPYLKKIGIPIAYFGILMGAFNFTAMTFSSLSGKVKKRFGINGSVLIINLLFLLSAFLMGATFGPVGALFIFGLQTVRGLQSPIFHDSILENTAPDSRATVISILNMLSRATFIIAAPLLGGLVDRYGIFAGFRITAVSVFLIIVCVYFYEKILERVS